MTALCPAQAQNQQRQTQTGDQWRSQCTYYRVGPKGVFDSLCAAPLSGLIRPSHWHHSVSTGHARADSSPCGRQQMRLHLFVDRWME